MTATNHIVGSVTDNNKHGPLICADAVFYQYLHTTVYLQLLRHCWQSVSHQINRKGNDEQN